MRFFRRCREVARAPREIVVVREDHAAAAGGDDLVAVEAEHRGMTKGPTRLSLPDRAERFGCILYDDKPVFCCDLHQRYHVNGVPENMDRDDRTNAPFRLSVEGP